MIFVYKLRKDSTWMPIHPHSWQNVLQGVSPEIFVTYFFVILTHLGP